MSEQLANLQSVVATMQAAPAPTPPELTPQSLLTPEELNE
jgi:hypothetical protein